MLAELFRKQVEEMNIICLDQEVKVTISLGVSELTEADSAEMMIKRADEALYQAKRTGRNKVVTLA